MIAVKPPEATNYLASYDTHSQFAVFMLAFNHYLIFHPYFKACSN